MSVLETGFLNQIAKKNNIMSAKYLAKTAQIVMMYKIYINIT